MSWRDTYEVHPAADVFPMVSDEELTALGEEIAEKNGLREPIKLMWVDRPKKIAEKLRTLELVADWRVDLSTRLERARLRHELIGLSPEEIIDLGDEVRDFTRLCKVLKAVTQ